VDNQGYQCFSVFGFSGVFQQSIILLHIYGVSFSSSLHIRKVFRTTLFFASWNFGARFFDLFIGGEFA
jgi:hypothetical protein